MGNTNEIWDFAIFLQLLSSSKGALHSSVDFCPGCEIALDERHTTKA